MKKYQKLLCILSAVAVLIGCCCFSASAATVNAGTGDQVYVGYPLDVVQGNKNADGSYWINYYSGRTSGELGIMFPVDLLVNRGDVVSWGSFYMSFYFSLSSTTTEVVALGLMDEYYGFSLLETVSFSSAKEGSFGVQFNSGQKQFDFDKDVKYICVKLIGSYDQTSPGTFGWQPYSFKLSSMDENSIMLEGVMSEQQQTNELLGDITADKYNPPSGTDKMDELTAKEEAVNQKAQQGMNEAGNMFKAFSLDPFSDGLIGAVQLFNRITPNMPWLNQLLTISLALGLFAFLVGAAQEYFNSNDRASRSPRQDAKYIKRDGIASHRPSRK